MSDLIRKCKAEFRSADRHDLRAWFECWRILETLERLL